MNALLRIARRTVLRNPGRSAVVVLLVMIPVTGLIIGLAGLEGATDRQRAEARQEFGTAKVVVDESSGLMAPDGTAALDHTAEELRSTFELPASAQVARQRVGNVAMESADGTADLVSWTEFDTSNPLFVDRYPMVSGRMPSAPGEVLVLTDSTNTSTHDEPADGSVLRIGLPELDVEVVGRARSASKFGQSFSLVAFEGSMTPAQRSAWYLSGLAANSRWFIDAPASAIDSEAMYGAAFLHPTSLPPARVQGDLAPTTENDSPFNGSITFSNTTSNALRSQIVALSTSTFAFLWCGLVAASALAIGAKRRRRDLGLLAVSGASTRQLRGAVVADGVVLGGLGALLGAAAGFGVCLWLSSGGVHLVGQSITGYWSFTPLMVAAPLMGWLCAIIAGTSAAVGVGRQPVVDLLAGRAPTPGAAPRWFAVGAATFGVCLGSSLLVRQASRSVEGGLLWLVPLAALSGVLSLVCLSVGGVRVLPMLTQRMSVSWRLGARDLARFGARTAAATAAISLTLGAATAAAVAERSDALNRQQFPEYSSSIGNTGSGSVNIVPIKGQRQVIRNGYLVPAPPTPALFDAIRGRVEGSKTTLTTFESVTDATLVACSDNSAQLTAAAAQVAPSGCTTANALHIDSAAAKQLPPTLADPLARGEIVGWINYNLEVTPINPIVRLGARTYPLTGITIAAVDELTQSSGENAVLRGVIANTAPLVKLLVPDQIWSESWRSLATTETTLIDNGDPNWSSINRDVQKLLGYEISVSPDWFRPYLILMGVCIGFVLLVLSLSLILVRLESTDEERTLRTQGATAAAAARVAGARALLATLVASVPAVLLTTIVVAATTASNERVEHPSLRMAVALMFGVPILAGAIFGVAGLRAPKSATGRVVRRRPAPTIEALAN